MLKNFKAKYKIQAMFLTSRYLSKAFLCLEGSLTPKTSFSLSHRKGLLKEVDFHPNILFCVWVPKHV